MEDIPRDLQKELDGYKVPKNGRQGRHWTLLFIGERGEVITIRKFKGLMLLGLFIMVVAISAATSIYMLYKKPFEENRKLEAALATAESRVRALGEEKDLLLTRLGIAESRIKQSPEKSGATEPADEKADARTAAVRSEPGPAAVEQAPQEARTSLQAAPADRVTSGLTVNQKALPEAETALEGPAEIKVDVRNFQVRHMPEENLLQVQFRLKNINLEAGAVSGRTFVVMQNDQGNGEDTLTFPQVTLVDGKPARIHLGRYFSISRFNIVKFKSAYEQPPRPFNSATVFVYSGAGDLLLEKKFSIENPFKASAAALPAEDQSLVPGAEEAPDSTDTNNTILDNQKKVTFNLARVLKLLIAALVMVPLALSQEAAAQERIHTVFFQGTDYELNVYRIHGQQPGKTILLIGGIQGDEPGGFLSVDLYADISLARGSLIVVPRANFHSIVLQRRQINEDMNRKFGHSKKKGYETEVVEILKKLIAESDCLLNMHDGSGFYSEKWESPTRNPGKYGQSIIADADTYIFKDKTAPVKLGEMAREVCRRINSHIEKPEFFFSFNNHKTAETDSRHKEQRKSATYFALTRHGIPAFGIETSKSLPLELKVRHHNLAVNAFMELLDVVPQIPGMSLEKPLLDYLVIAVNDTRPVVLKNQQTLHVAEGDRVTISHIEANYERGLSADLVGLGTINDLRKTLVIRAPARIVVRKDYYPCGSVYIDIGPRTTPVAAVTAAVSPRQKSVTPGALSFKVKRNDVPQMLENYGHFKLIRGDVFEIVDVVTALADPSELVVNVKGFVGNRANNTGEDRGYRINSGKDLWKRYSIKKAGTRYRVIVTLDDKQVGKLFIDLAEPE